MSYFLCKLVQRTSFDVADSAKWGFFNVVSPNYVSVREQSSNNVLCPLGPNSWETAGRNFWIWKRNKIRLCPPTRLMKCSLIPRWGGVWVKVGFWKHSLLKVIQFLLMQFAWKLKAYFWDFSKDRAWVWGLRGLRGQRLVEGQTTTSHWVSPANIDALLSD